MISTPRTSASTLALERSSARRLWLRATIITLVVIVFADLVRQHFSLVNPLEVALLTVGLATAIAVGVLERRLARGAHVRREHEAGALALQESDARYRMVLDASPDGISLQRADFSIEAWNEAAERITGLTKAQLSGLAPRPSGWRAIHEDGSPFQPAEHPSFVTLRTGEAQSGCVMGIRHPDGRLVWISMNTMPLIHPGETRPYAAVTSFTDVTTRREAEAALRESEQRFQLLAMQAPVGIFHTDPAGSYTFVNERYCVLTTIRPRAALGDGWQLIIHPEDRARVVVEWLSATHAGLAFRTEYRMRALGGETIWVEGSAEPVRDRNGAVTGYIGIVHDLSERKEAEEALRTLSLRDELTGLWNRRGFLAFGEQECRRARRARSTVVVMYGDVDGFKRINDTFGHRAGDEALAAVAAALQSTCRDVDVVARLGGDEFVVLSVHDTPSIATAAESAMRARLEARLEAVSADHACTLTLSLGAAHGSGADAMLEPLIARADEALYAGKRERQAAVAHLSAAE